MNILFICRENTMRSPTAETIYAQEGMHHARSAGTARRGKGEITKEILLWADTIFVMEEIQEAFLREKFPEEVCERDIITLHIHDNYYYMEPELVDLIKERVTPCLVKNDKTRKPVKKMLKRCNAATEQRSK